MILPILGASKSNPLILKINPSFLACTYVMISQVKKKCDQETGINIDIKCGGLSPKKLQQSQIRLNVPVQSETRLRRGTSLFTLKRCTLAITKPGYPLQVKGFGCLMHSCPLFTAQTTLSKATLHFNSLGGLAGQAYERRRFLLKQRVEV